MMKQTQKNILLYFLGAVLLYLICAFWVIPNISTHDYSEDITPGSILLNAFIIGVFGFFINESIERYIKEAPEVGRPLLILNILAIPLSMIATVLYNNTQAKIQVRFQAPLNMAAIITTCALLNLLFMIGRSLYKRLFQ